ncbi:sensor histidine kinase [Cellulomonas sp. JZ18]|uniref:sensor histidine kinase n=1 Tax=Cellulomonas sp. JZ18 TaxID=2654191 RepID=UPI001E2B66EA|nr:hypothetical protein [Cellulomonas sp. JZ18]
MTVVALSARTLEAQGDCDGRAATRRAIGDAAMRAVADVRHVLRTLRGDAECGPECVPRREGIAAALGRVAEHLRVAGVTVSVSVPDAVEVPPRQEAALVMSAREAVTNILRHGVDVTRADLVLTVDEGLVTLLVEDDGTVRDTGAPPPVGFGLARMGERARELGGACSAGPSAGGWAVRLTLPPVYLRPAEWPGGPPAKVPACPT